MKPNDPINQEILKHLGEGLTYNQISGKVFRSKHAVRWRTRKMREECGAKNNTELVAKSRISTSVNS